MACGSNGYPAHHRMKYRWEFSQVKKEGTAFAGKLIVFSAVRHSERKHPRIGYIITRRIGSAVVRNTIRRRLREVYRTHRHVMNHGLSIVLIARPAVVRASYKELSKEFRSLYKTAHRTLL